MRLGRAVPYPVESIRSVTLVAKAGRLFLDVTAEVPVAGCHPDPARVAGIDLGIIHPYAMMAGDEGLLVSGRAIRAEERLHLDDTKRRACRTVHIICGKFATPLRAESSPARTAGIGATAISSVPETSPPGPADPRVRPHASRTVGPGVPRHGVTGAVTSSTCAGPARPGRPGRPGSRPQGDRPGAGPPALGVVHAV